MTGAAGSRQKVMTALGVLGLAPFIAAPLRLMDVFGPGVAWPSLQALYAAAILAFLGLAFALAAQGAWDITAKALPDWYRRLRLPLTAVACLALVAGALLARHAS